MPRWPIELQSKHSGAITLGKSGEKEKGIPLGTAVIDGNKAFWWGVWMCMENCTHSQGHSRACKGWKTMPGDELLKHLDSSER